MIVDQYTCIEETLSSVRTDLQLSSQALEHTPKDLGTKIEYLVDGAQGVSTDSQTEILLGRQEEGSVLR